MGMKVTIQLFVFDVLNYTIRFRGSAIQVLKSWLDTGDTTTPTGASA